MQGIDNYLLEFNKLSEAVREIPTGRMLQQKMLDFRDSVAIMVQLKNAALRRRHWQCLMDWTGNEFDWRQDGGFLLKEIFEMNLHRFQVCGCGWAEC